jgi:hypothetical protein
MAFDRRYAAQDRFGAWEKSFKSISKDVGHLMLPHHGAAANFNSKLLTFVPGEARCFATVNSEDNNDNLNSEDDKRRTRPPLEVRQEVGERLAVVTEKSDVLIGYSGGRTLESEHGDKLKTW